MTRRPGWPAASASTGRSAFVKEWGAASPQFFQALCTNEILKSVLFEFVKVDANGEEYVFHTIRLTNASVSEIEQYIEDVPGSAAHDARPLEKISMTFQKIELENKDGKTTAVDDWFGGHSLTSVGDQVTGWRGQPRAAPYPRRAARPSALRGAYGARHSPPCAAAYASSCQGCSWRGPPSVCRSCTSRAAISTFDVDGSNTSTPKRWAPAYAAASARFFTTDLVRVGGATFIETVAPWSRATVARQRCSRLASA